MHTTDDRTDAAGAPVERPVRPGSEARWCVEEANTGLPVAQGSAPTAEDASREAMHYAMQYGQDGPVRWWVRQNRKTVMEGKMSGTNNVEVRGGYTDLRKLLKVLKA